MTFTPKHLILLVALPAGLAAQRAPADTTPTTATSATATPASTPHYWRNMAIGFASSIVLHEAGHVIASYAVGGHPSLGSDRGRPTIYSGIDATQDPHKQFVFSAAGLTIQTLLDEAILDVPHHRGAAFERGLLTGGIATAYFYATLGRNASNSDITYMARTSSLSKTQASLIYAGLATVHAIRIARDSHYDHFFIRPGSGTRSDAMRVGMQFDTH